MHLNFQVHYTETYTYEKCKHYMCIPIALKFVNKIYLKNDYLIQITNIKLLNNHRKDITVFV